MGIGRGTTVAEWPTTGPRGRRTLVARAAVAVIGALLATSLSATAAHAETATPPASISGRVVNADGLPVQNIAVRQVLLSAASRSVKAGYGVLTDADGRFVISLPSDTAASTSLQFSRSHIASTFEYATEFWGGTALVNEAEIIHIEANSHVTLADFELSPARSISGYTATPSGQVSTRTWATAWAWNESADRWEVALEQFLQGGSSTQTDIWPSQYFGSRFALRGLPPGEYRICVTASGPDRTAPQCYIDTPSPAESPPIDVTEGSVANIEFYLYTGAQIDLVARLIGTGTSKLDYTTKPGTVVGTKLRVYGQDPVTGAWQEVVGAQTTLSDGTVRKNELRSGTYRVFLDGGDRLSSEWYPNAATLEEAADIEVTAGGEIPRLDARIYGLHSNRGTFVGLGATWDSMRPGLSTITASATILTYDYFDTAVGTLELLVGDRVVASTPVTERDQTLKVNLPDDLKPGVQDLWGRFRADPTEGFFLDSESMRFPITVLPRYEFSTVPKPTISGATRVGSTLTATAGTWKPAPSKIAYQWFRSGIAIAGATARTYGLVAADAGAAITVRATATRAGYTTRYRTSAPTPLVTGKPLTLGTPKITGSVHVDRTLTVSPGSWGPAPVTLSYRWKRNGVSIVGATGSTYVLTTADAGASITVTVTGKKTGYTTASRTTAAVTVPRVLTSTPTPTISGTAVAGATLTANPGTWGPGTVSLSYTWKRDGAAIAGAISRTYRLTAADAGRSVTVTVSGRRTGYTTVSKTSAPRLITAAAP